MRSNSTQVCSRCVLDSTVHDIWFDEGGECKYCKIHNELETTHPLGEQGELYIQHIVAKIKKAGQGKEYDCVCGLSGGRDSSYVLLKVIEYGLRPLIITLDNGWNTQIAKDNIRNACEILNLELQYVEFNKTEYLDMQRAFFFAGVPDIDSPTDLAIYAVLYKTAKKNGIKYIINGHSFRTEGSSPISWSFFDPKYIKDIQRKYGTIKYNDIKSIPVISSWDLIRFTFVDKIKEVRLLEFMDYRKKDVDEVLKSNLGWQDYGGHHHENKFTHFIQSYYLPKKFNIDKRKTELSAQIRSQHIVKSEPYPF